MPAALAAARARRAVAAEEQLNEELLQALEQAAQQRR
jgi:hypothetical protein